MKLVQTMGPEIDILILTNDTNVVTDYEIREQFSDINFLDETLGSFLNFRIPSFLTCKMEMTTHDLENCCKGSYLISMLSNVGCYYNISQGNTRLEFVIKK